MNAIRLEFITSIGPGTSKQHQERDVDIKVFIDEQELDLGAGWDLQALIASGRQEGAYYLSNCSCGEPGCARIWAPMQVRHEADRIAWMIPMNVLTVIPNESYEAFAKSLQQEIEDETGVKFTGRVKNARAKVKVKPKDLDAEEAALFEAIWKKINYQTRYSVKLDTPELIDACKAALADTNQYPRVQAPKIRSAKAKIVMTHEGVHGVQSGAANTDVREFNVTVPDVYAYIQNRVHLSRATLFAILDGSGRLEELLINPQAFLDTAIAAIKNSLQELLVKGIEYHEINGKRYEMTLWEEVETYQSSIFPPVADQMTPPVSKTILQAQPLDDQKADVGEAFSCVLIDSTPESKFAQDCSDDERVRFFFKLPSRFKIPTPLGTYNPDWAVVFEGDARVYFVAETKSSTVEQDRRQAENLKIDCGRKHFALSEDVVFRDVTELEGLVA